MVAHPNKYIAFPINLEELHDAEKWKIVAASLAVIIKTKWMSH